MYVELVLFRLCATCPSANHQTTIKTKTSEIFLTQLYETLKKITVYVIHLISNDRTIDCGRKFYQRCSEDRMRDVTKLFILKFQYAQNE